MISGGQRKRVNIAMELLSDPSALFLDEPTSGLSSYDAAQVVRLLRRLADSGKTIICTIHQPSVDIFKDFDSLIMVARDKGDNAGALVYFGPAYPDSIHFFNPPKDGGAAEPAAPEALMTGLAGRRALDWVGTYQQSRYNKEFIEARAGRIVSAPGTAARRRDFGFGQLVTLSRRNLLLKLRDRSQTAILLAQAPLFAVLVSIVFFGMTDREFTDPAAWAEFSGKVASAHFLMVVAAVWFGCNNAARDIVGETTHLPARADGQSQAAVVRLFEDRRAGDAVPVPVRRPAGHRLLLLAAVGFFPHAACRAALGVAGRDGPWPADFGGLADH